MEAGRVCTVNEVYDVVVIGGGAAGLAGATGLARARRSVLVIDEGHPRNAPAEHIHNYLGREGTPPSALLADARAQLAEYGGEYVTARAEWAGIGDGAFTIRLDDGSQVAARRLLITTGLADELPDLPGLADRWGRDVLHCPYCHGWEVRDRRIGVLASGPVSGEQAELWRQWSDHVLLLLHETAPLHLDQIERLAARAISVVQGRVVGLEVDGDALAGVRLTSGEVVELDALVVRPRFCARSAVLEGLGLKPVEVEVGGQVVATQVPADATGATVVPGVWIAGNVADFRAQVISSAAAGLNAAAAINADLIAEDTREAVEAYRHRVRELMDQASWEARYSEKPSIWSGKPNPQLVSEIEGMSPGRALDVGSGEGADAVWLAQRGWRVTGVDISRTALAKAEQHARAVGAEIAERIEWRHADLRVEAPEPAAYELVSSQFMHLPTKERRELFSGLAAAVAPGGTLLIVGHHPSDLRTSAHRMHFPDMMFTAEEVADTLDPALWDIVSVQSRPRSVKSSEGHHTTIQDAVLVARRLASPSSRLTVHFAHDHQAISAQPPAPAPQAR